MSYYRKKPCSQCPFRRDVKPFLHPERAYDIAIHAQNPYNSFPCHKTLEHDEDDEGSYSYAGAESKECAGFLTLRAKELGEDSHGIPDGFEPAYDQVYDDVWDMEYAYDEQWEKQRGTN